MQSQFWVWRPLIAGKLTLTELKTVATIEDVLTINALLDMQADVEKSQYEENKK